VEHETHLFLFIIESYTKYRHAIQVTYTHSQGHKTEMIKN